MNRAEAGRRNGRMAAKKITANRKQEILALLMERGDCGRKEIAEAVGIARTTANFHLAEMVKSGVLQTLGDGNSLTYAVGSGETPVLGAARRMGRKPAAGWPVMRGDEEARDATFVRRVVEEGKRLGLIGERQ